jgi:GcrA cell cycle regulator
MSWTDERIETLRKLWEKGLTASQIAETLGSVSRNAVIGKAHRLGLKSRPSPVKGEDSPAPARKAAAPKAKPKPEAKAPAPEKATPKAAPVVKTTAPAVPTKLSPVERPVPRLNVALPTRPMPSAVSRAPGDKVTLLDLSDKICKWPIGHPDEADFHFCGRPVNPGFPYCIGHCAEAYQAQLPRDRSRPSRPPMPNLPRPR